MDMSYPPIPSPKTLGSVELKREGKNRPPPLPLPLPHQPHISDAEDSPTEFYKEDPQKKPPDNRQYTDEQSREIERVLEANADDPYEILRVPDPSEKKVIRRAYRGLSLSLHPDKNRDPRAKHAFQKVNDAARSLGIPNESMSKTAFGPEYEGPDSENVYDHGPVPQPYHRKLYTKATPYIIRTFSNPRDAKAIEAIHDVNKELAEQSKKHGLSMLEQNYFSINCDAIVGHGLIIRNLAQKLVETPTTQYKSKLKEFQRQLHDANRTIDQLVRERHYPEDWAIKFRWDKNRRELQVTRPKTDGSGSNTALAEPKDERGTVFSDGFGSESEDSEDTEMLDESDPGTPKQFDVSSFRTKGFIPGQTPSGERILACRVSGRGARELFIVQVGGKSSQLCEIRSRTDIGHRAADLYLSWPRRNEIASCQDLRSDEISNIGPILLVACSQSGHRLLGYAKIERTLSDGSVRVYKAWLWRTTLRELLGKTTTDNRIEGVYEEEGVPPPWVANNRTGKLLTYRSSVRPLFGHHMSNSRLTDDSDLTDDEHIARKMVMGRETAIPKNKYGRGANCLALKDTAENEQLEIRQLARRVAGIESNVDALAKMIKKIAL